MKLYESKSYMEYKQRCEWFRGRCINNEHHLRDIVHLCCVEAAYDAGLDDSWGKVFVDGESVNGIYCFSIHIHFRNQASWESSSFFMDELDRAKRNIQFVVSGRFIHKRSQEEERMIFWNAVTGKLSRIFKA